MLLFGEGSSGLEWEAAKVIPWFIQILSGCSRPRQKTSFISGRTHWRSSNSFTKIDLEVCFHCLAPSPISPALRTIWVGQYEEAFTQTLFQAPHIVQGSLSRKADWLTSATCSSGCLWHLWLAKNSTPACSLQQTPLALHPLQSPWLTCLLAAQQRFFYFSKCYSFGNGKRDLRGVGCASGGLCPICTDLLSCAVKERQNPLQKHCKKPSPMCSKWYCQHIYGDYG